MFGVRLLLGHTAEGLHFNGTVYTDMMMSRRRRTGHDRKAPPANKLNQMQQSHEIPFFSSAVVVVLAGD